MVWWFYFFIPMVFGLIRPGFCYVTFLKIPYFFEEISCILWFFWESFSEKNQLMVSSWRSMIFFCIIFSRLQFWPEVVFSLLQIFLTCFLAFLCLVLSTCSGQIFSAFCRFFFLNKAKTCFDISSFISWFYLFLSFKNHP